MNRIIFEEETTSLAKTDQRCSHILSVLKLNEGQSFEMGVLNSYEAKATISHIDKDSISFTIGEKQGLSPLFPVSLIVPQVRPICMKRILRDCTMLGVGTIAVCSCDTSEKSYASSGLWVSGEYRKYLLDGVMQAGVASMAKVLFYNSIDAGLRDLGKDSVKLVLDNRGQSEPLSRMSFEKGQRITLALGPERGWSDRERFVFKQEGYHPCLIGTRILRTETALNVGLAVLYARMGLL